jgi:hypothetical protein
VTLETLLRRHVALAGVEQVPEVVVAVAVVPLVRERLLADGDPDLAELALLVVRASLGLLGREG